MAESKRSLMIFKPFFQKLQKGFSSSAYSASQAVNHSKFNEELSVGKAVPCGVKEGFFTVFAVKGKEMQRFVIEFYHFKNPEFLCLLDQAREEYGFQQKGVLSLTCRPHELLEILEHNKGNHACTQSWDICNATILEGY
ncbi:hypothetical protein V6N13_059869 [Hibiscus sabdariffa]|uniref:Uncharacterized protein n=1 Tax=Hibiscus sabdariffa TaxID=183260 RepID=A0ABR2GBQ0_9ROSI